MHRTENAFFHYFLDKHVTFNHLHVSYLESCKLILRSLCSGWRQSGDRVVGLRPCLG